MDLGKKLGENGIFCQVWPVTAQKVWCRGRLLNTNNKITSLARVLDQYRSLIVQGLGVGKSAKKGPPGPY